MDFDMFLDQLKSRLRIEDVVSEYVSLRKSSGSRFVGLCPFHSEKTPSFTVFTDDQHFYCFGCGKGGDLITFIRQIESLDYMDALRLLGGQSRSGHAPGAGRRRVPQAAGDSPENQP